MLCSQSLNFLLVLNIDITRYVLSCKMYLNVLFAEGMTIIYIYEIIGIDNL